MNTPLQEDLEFLEHFGIKGQKWGVRREAMLNARANKLNARANLLDAKANLAAVKNESFKTETAIKTKAQAIKAKQPSHLKRNLKIAGTVAGAAAIAAGGIWASRALKSNFKNVKVRDFTRVVMPDGTVLSGNHHAVSVGANFVHEHMQQSGWTM